MNEECLSVVKDMEVWVASHPHLSRQNKKLTRVTFLTIKDHVEAALDSGFSIRMTWQYMLEMDRICCSYRSFCNLVQKYIREPSDKDKPVARPKKDQER